LKTKMIEFEVEGIRVLVSEKVVHRLKDLHNVDAISDIKDILKKYKDRLNENKSITQ
jgi:hypothetical protein